MHRTRNLALVLNKARVGNAMSKFKRTLMRRLIFGGAVIGGGTAVLAAGTMTGAALAYWV